ncbi:hypothetical protein MN1_650 [Thermus phage MN1]|nr:hypothetical protein MN1_650 [Thermus phage MN1]
MEFQRRSVVIRFEEPGVLLEATTLLREGLKNARPFYLREIEPLPILLPSGEWEDREMMVYRDGAVDLVVDWAGDVSLAVEEGDEGERFLRVMWAKRDTLLGVSVVGYNSSSEAVVAVRTTLEAALRLLPIDTPGALAVCAALTLLKEWRGSLPG